MAECTFLHMRQHFPFPPLRLLRCRKIQRWTFWLASDGGHYLKISLARSVIQELNTLFLRMRICSQNSQNSASSFGTSISLNKSMSSTIDTASGFVGLMIA